VTSEVCIYGLVDPRDNAVRYIGQTDDVKRRAREHVRAPHSPAIAAWIAEMAAEGHLPVATVLERCDRASANAAEARWLAEHAGRLINAGNAGAGRRPVGSGCRRATPSRNRLVVLLDPDELAQLDAYVAKRGHDRSHWVRLALRKIGALK
jgi:hypothetical protein